jgi:hypothetical protein
MTNKICINCKHIRHRNYIGLVCNHEQSLDDTSYTAVSGEKDLTKCVTMRVTKCKDGILFEEKSNFFRKIIKYFKKD